MAALSSQALSALATGALALTGSGGVLCLSGHATPGDALYGVKTGISEPLTAAFALSPSAKANAATNRAGARLGEASDLATDGDLTNGLIQDLSAAFQNDANNALQRIADLADTNPKAALDLVGRLQKVLDSQADLLSSPSLHVEAATDDSLDKLTGAARVEADAAKKLGLAIDQKVDGGATEAKANAALSAATTALADARANAAAAKNSLDAADNADLNAQINAAAHALTDGQAQLAAGGFAEASDLLNSSSRLSDEASIFADTMSDLEATGNLNEDSVLNSLQGQASGSASGSGSGNVSGSTGGVNVGGSASGSGSGSGSVSGSTGSGSASGSADSGAGLDADGLLPGTGIDLDDSGNVVGGVSGDIVNPL